VDSPVLCWILRAFILGLVFLNNTIGDLQKNPIRKEVWKMHNLAIYELVDAKMRDTINLTAMQHSIEGAFAQVYPEASDIKVYRDFYCYRHPVSLIEERVVRARCLGKVIARATREFTQRAMRSYESEGHPRSNQLFKAVKGKKRLRYCLRLLEEISVES
jgi:hypothetical protein